MSPQPDLRLYLLSICILLLFPHIYGRMNDTTRKLLLTLHNDARQAVRNGKLNGQPKAVSIKPLKWNMELERKAQKLSDQCRVGHDTEEERETSEFEYVGQNWAGASKVKIGFQLWLSEYKSYDFSRQKCRAKQCGHYTQIVWEKTTDLGCGVTDCPNFPYRLSIVCNYGTGGNYIGHPPYKTTRTQVNNLKVK
ncbi:unnamed protein product [Heterobilharzia americana]|nr:unnamed protein product [Heterobilharzia americana]